MRIVGRFATISLSAVVVLIASIFIFASVSFAPPKENKIVSDFRAHRDSYERVRTMLLEDKGIVAVAPWGVQGGGSGLWKTPPSGGMPVKRYQEYLALLNEIGANRVSEGGDPLEISFGVWRSGFAGDQRHVDVSWLEREPSNTVTSLKDFYQTNKPRSPSYVHIDGNWYIWADW